MHPAVKRFSERYPRTYGLIFFVAALILGRLGQRPGLGNTALVLFLLSVAFGLTGVAYLVLGPKCSRWNERFVESFDPNSVSWRQAMVLTAFGLGLVLIAIVLYRSAR